MNVNEHNGRTYQYGSVLNITYKDRKTNIWVRERAKVIDISSDARKNEMVVGRVYQPPQGRPMDLSCHYLETTLFLHQHEVVPSIYFTFLNFVKH